MKKSIIIILAVVVILVIWAVSVYNGLVTMDENVSGQWANVETQYQRRADLIPNLVNTVKGYATHEKETLEKVIAARNAAQGASGIADKVQAENALQGTLRSLFAVAEAYPDLKANTNFLDLQDQLKYVEEDIANARKFYNAVVKQYNNKCEMFPSNLIASIFHFERMPMFEVSAPEQRENVKVQF